MKNEQLLKADDPRCLPAAGRMSPPGPARNRSQAPTRITGETRLEQAVARAIQDGVQELPVSDPDGALLGTFQLNRFLRFAAAGGAWGLQDPVRLHLVGRNPRAGNEALSPLAAQLLLGMAGGAAPLSGILDGRGRTLHLGAAFREALDRVQGPLDPASLVPAAAGGALAIGVLASGRRSFVTLGFPPAATGGLTFLLGLELTEGLAEDHRQLLEENDLLNRLVDAPADGMMFVKPDGTIARVNSSWEEIHGIPRALAIGRHVTELVANTRMHIVARTRVAEWGDVQDAAGHQQVVSRIPVFRDGQCLGVVGQLIFQEERDLHRLAARVRQLRNQVDCLQRAGGAGANGARYHFDDIVARAPVSLEARERAVHVASLPSTVLLAGESGVGKEVYAQAIHNLSRRCQGPFVRVNCAAIPESRFEAELFGRAGTDAAGARTGKFALAATGTLFLDEVGDLPLGIQARLLRELQERDAGPAGGSDGGAGDVRIIAATHQDLPELVERGRFRRDLFHRLNVIPIAIPPLRQRPEDIPGLIALLWRRLQQSMGTAHRVLDPGAQALLVRQPWPGNVRELRNVLERALAITRETAISAEQVQLILRGGGSVGASSLEDGEARLDQVIELAERRAIGFALARANNNRTQAAAQLGISRAMLYRKIHQYHLD
jgi:transcriptional regulator with PAS, ATPase and Fis domain